MWTHITKITRFNQCKIDLHAISRVTAATTGFEMLLFDACELNFETSLFPSSWSHFWSWYYSVSRFVFVDIGGRLQMIPSSDQSLYNHQNWAKLSPDPRRVKKSYQFRNHYKTNSGIEWLCCSCCSSRQRCENWSSDLRWS